jgi:hypothetical protein
MKAIIIKKYALPVLIVLKATMFLVPSVLTVRGYVLEQPERARFEKRLQTAGVKFPALSRPVYFFLRKSGRDRLSFESVKSFNYKEGRTEHDS